MSATATRFRKRARDCLNLSKGARQRADRIMLEEIAADLEAEAKKIEGEEETKPAGEQADHDASRGTQSELPSVRSSCPIVTRNC